MTNYTTTLYWRGHDIETLADIVDKDLRVLFVGINPSCVSVQEGHYHRGLLGKQLWKLLVQHGILPQPDPGTFHDELLLEHHLGITDLVKVPSARADGLDQVDIDYGRGELHQKIRDLRPKIVCSVYKRALRELCGTSFRNQWGNLGREFEGSALFALPFPYQRTEFVVSHMRSLKDAIGGASHD